MTTIDTSKIKYLVIHHTAVSYELNPDQFNATNDFHKLKWNFISSLGYYVGYNYEIAKDGTVRQARADGEETAAVIGHNNDSISICLDGNFDIEYPTVLQINSLRKLILTLIDKYSIKIQNIVLHRYFCGNPPYKSCAGNLLPDTWGQVLVINPSPSDMVTMCRSLGSTQPLDREAE